MANFEGADLSQANFEGARIDGANLKRARFFRTNLVSVDLVSSDMEEAILIQANLTKADLNNIRLEQAIILDTILTNANNLQVSQLDQAYICGVKLPDNIKIDSDRDCGEIELILTEEYAWLENKEQAREFIEDLRRQFSW